jgi:hypothetical protein
MAVQKTESRLPVLVGSPDELGLVFLNGTNLIVSYLQHPIQNREQHYVVFPDASLLANVTKFSWKTDNNGIPLDKDSTSGAFSFTPKKVGDLKIQLDLKDSSNAVLGHIEFAQVVFPTDEILERVIDSPGTNTPEAAHPETTREIVNDLADFVEDMVPRIIMDEFNRLILAIAYSATLEIKASTRNSRINEASKLLNSNRPNEWVTNINTGMGVCNIRPLLAAMFVEKTAGATYLPFTELPEKDKDKRVVLKQLADDFNLSTEDEKIDLHNRLRFPKSNLTICKQLFEALQAHYFPGETLTQILTDKTKATQLIDQFLSGPLVFTKASNKSKQIFVLMQAKVFQIPRQRPFTTFDHFLTEEFSFTTDSFMNSTATLSPFMMINDFYNPSQPDVINSDPALQAKVDAIIDKPAFANFKNDFTIAIADLTGPKLFHPTFAGWLEKRNMYAASSAKIGILYATYQLHADVNHFLRTNSAITTKVDLITELKKIWTAKSIPPADFPNVNDTFDLDATNSPAVVNFKPAVTAHLKHISSNSDPSALRALTGFRYLGSCLLQSGLFNLENGGIWLSLSYDGTSWSGNPFKGFASHNINALGGALMFILIAQGRLIGRHYSNAMKANLNEGGCLVALDPALVVTDIQFVAAKCGILGEFNHNFTLIQTSTQTWVIAIMTKSGQTTIIQKLFKELVTALST